MRLQGLKRITLSYAPLLPGSASAAQFFNECTTQRALQSNPDCTVELNLMDRGVPEMGVEFVTGAKLSVLTRGKTVKELRTMIDEKQQDLKTLEMLREEGYKFDALKPEEIPTLEQARAMAKPFAQKYYEKLKPI